MRDKYSDEAAQLFKGLGGYYRKFPDLGYRDKSRKLLEAAPVKPGTPDALFMHRAGSCFIEHKTGDSPDRIRFTYAHWTMEQRLFHVYAAEIAVPYYLFLVMGRDIRDKTYPRIAYLFDPVLLLATEHASTRKSLAYDDARTLLADTALVWTQGKWALPESHFFRTHFLKESSHVPRAHHAAMG